MASDLVNARPDDVKKLARALQTYEEKIRQATREARRAIDGAHWQDGQKDRFVSHFKDFEKRTNGFVAGEVKGMVGNLNKLASDLERARSQRF